MKLNIVMGLLLMSLAACSGGTQKESTGEYLDSASITTKVKSSLVADKRVSALDIKVVTYKKTVQLSGFVNTAEEKQLAHDIAEGVNGVEKVENNISVKDN